MARREDSHGIQSSKEVKRTTRREQQTSHAIASKRTIRKAREILEKQLEEADRVEAERIIKKRAPKTERKKRKETIPRQTSSFKQGNSSRSLSKPSHSHRFDHGGARKAPASTSEKSDGETYINRELTELPVSYENPQKTQDLLMEYFPSRQFARNAQLSRQTPKKPGISYPLQKENSISHRHEMPGGTTHRRGRLGSSYAPDYSKGRFDFTENSLSSSAYISSVQSDIFTDGSMLSPKPQHRDVSLPSSMDIDDGILYDMRSEPESKGEDKFEELPSPVKRIEYVHPYYTSGSDDHGQRTKAPPVEESTRTRMETRSVKTNKQPEPSISDIEEDYIPFIPAEWEKQEEDRRRWKELQEKGKGGQKRKSAMNHKQRNKQHPTSAAVPKRQESNGERLQNLATDQSLSQLTAMREQIIFAQQRLYSAQRQMQAILPVLNQLSPTMPMPGMFEVSSFKGPQNDKSEETLHAGFKNTKVQIAGNYDNLTSGFQEELSAPQPAEGNRKSGNKKKHLTPRDRVRRVQVKKMQGKARGNNLRTSLHVSPQPTEDDESVGFVPEEAHELIPSIEVDDDTGSYAFSEDARFAQDSENYVPSTSTSSWDSQIPKKPPSPTNERKRAAKASIFGEWKINDFSQGVDESLKMKGKVDEQLSPEQHPAVKRLKPDFSNERYREVSKTSKIDTIIHDRYNYSQWAQSRRRSSNPSPSTLSTNANPSEQRIYTPSTTSTPVPPHSYLHPPTTSKPVSKFQFQSNNLHNLRLITPITIINTSAFDSPTPRQTPEPTTLPISPQKPRNTTLEKVKSALQISPTTIPLPHPSPLSLQKRVYTPSSLSSTANSSRGVSEYSSSSSSSSSYDVLFTNPEPFSESDGPPPSRKKMKKSFMIKRVRRPFGIASTLPPMAVPSAPKE